MIPTQPALQRPERMFAERSALAHRLGGGGHPRAVAIHGIGMLGAVNLPARGLLGQTGVALRARPAVALVAAVTLAQDTVLGRGLPARREVPASRADVDIQLGVVMEGAAGQAALGVGRALLLGQRDIDGDTARLAGRNLRFGEIAAVGEDLRRRDLCALGALSARAWRDCSAITVSWP